MSLITSRTIKKGATFIRKPVKLGLMIKPKVSHHKERHCCNTYICFIITCLEDEFFGMMLPVLEGYGARGFIGGSQADGRFSPIACLKIIFTLKVTSVSLVDCTRDS